MAAILKARIKRLPSGMTSVVISQVSPSSPLGSRAKLRQRPIAIRKTILECLLFRTWAKIILPAGKGGLGNKRKASWRTLRNARERMAAIELEYGVANCGFLTLTLPSVNIDSFEALARYSSYAMDRLNRVLNRYFEGQDLARVSVWEYQKRGALHCHLLIASNRIHAMKGDDFIAYIQKAWYRILEDIGEIWGANMFVSSLGEYRSLEQLQSIKNKKGENVFVNFQIVRKSIVAYLSKYLSDSNHEKNKLSKQQLREKFFPIATWVQWNKKATALYEKYLDEFDLGECEIDKKPMVYRMIQSLKKRIIRQVPLARRTEIKEPENPYNCGLYVIPANPSNKRLPELLAEFIGKMSCFFREDIKEKYNHHLKPMSQEEMDVKLTLDHINMERLSNKKNAFDWLDLMLDRGGNGLANLGLFMLDLGQAFIDRFKPKQYEQLSIDYAT
jgi:hypothetical protein